MSPAAPGSSWRQGPSGHCEDPELGFIPAHLDVCLPHRLREPVLWGVLCPAVRPGLLRGQEGTPCPSWRGPSYWVLS